MKENLGGADVNHHSFCEPLKTKHTMYTSCYVSLKHEIHLVFFRYCVGQNIAAGAGGHMTISCSTKPRRGGSGGGGLLRVLQLLPVYFPLFSTSVLKPDLHLKQR